MADTWEQAGTYVLQSVARHDIDLKELRAENRVLETRVYQLVLGGLMFALGMIGTLAAYIVTQR